MPLGLRSQQLGCARAWADGRFEREVAPIGDPASATKGSARPASGALAELKKPAASDGGIHTAGILVTTHATERSGRAVLGQTRPGQRSA